MTPTKEQPRYLIQSALSTLEVLLVFGRPPHRFSPSEVAQQLGVDRNQAFRSLRTLQHVGFVRVEDDDRFVLTGLVDQLSAVSQPQTSLVAAARAAMDDIVQATGETVNLFRLDGLEMVCVDHRDGLRPVRLVTEPGRRTPLHAGACPKAALAFLPPARQEEVIALLPDLPRFTPHTLGAPDDLRAELAATRARGYAISDRDIDEEARGVGAAVFGPDERVVGAVSVGGPASRMTPARLAELGDVIQGAAHRVSRQLGYNGPVYARME